MTKSSTVAASTASTGADAGVLAEVEEPVQGRAVPVLGPQGEALDVRDVVEVTGDQLLGGWSGDSPTGEGLPSALAEATFEAVARATARLPSTFRRWLTPSSR